MEALLIVDGRPNETLSQVIEALGVADEIGPGWPRADLDVSQGVAIRCDDWDGLAELIERRPQARVMAFYSGPLEDVENIEGQTVSHLGRRYALRKVLSNPAWDPYVHRLLIVERRGVGTEGGSLERVAAGAAGNLFFCPLLTPIDVGQLSAVGYTGSQMNAVMLPPTGRDADATYFDCEFLSLRKQLHAYLADHLELAWTPSALALLELVDRPDFQAFMTDGGCLKLVDDEAGISRLILETASPDPVAAYRSGFFEANDSEERALRRIRSCLRADLLASSPGIAIQRTRAVHSWGDYELRGYRHGDRSAGSWQLIRLLLSELGSMISPELQETLGRRVLDPASARGTESPDHGLAEEALIRDLARVPWAPHGPKWNEPCNSAWIEAIVWLCLQGLAAQSDVPGFGNPPWMDSESGWELEVQSVHERTVYYPRSHTECVFRWRLHAPIGTAFLRDGWSRIDEPETMSLDGSLRLQ
jgi:hypothetical protein